MNNDVESAGFTWEDVDALRALVPPLRIGVDVTDVEFANLITLADRTLDLDALKALGVKATPGPWKYTPKDLAAENLNEDEYAFEVQWQADDELIVAARNALPALIEAAEERDRLREALREIYKMTAWRVSPHSKKGHWVEEATIVRIVDHARAVLEAKGGRRMSRSKWPPMKITEALSKGVRDGVAQGLEAELGWMRQVDWKQLVAHAWLGRRVVEEREALRLIESELDDYGWGGADETLEAMQKVQRILAEADRLAAEGAE